MKWVILEMEEFPDGPLCYGDIHRKSISRGILETA
jgi:hypothetical protein